MDGLSKIGKLVAKTKELGQTAVAITDHGSMYGAIEFYKKALKEEIKPIIGCEIYLAKSSRLDKTKSDANHLILLAENFEGYQNLLKIVTIGQTEGFYYKPRVDKETLSKYSKGLICTTACPAGRVQKLLIEEGVESAKKELIEYEQIFGSGNIFIELQRHHYDRYALNPLVPAEIKPKLLDFHQNEIKAEAGLIKLSRELGIPLIATNDSHYINQEDAAAQDALVCVQTGKMLDDTNRMRFVDTPDFYLKSPDEMGSEFQDLPETLDNTQKIAERCDVSIKLGEWYFPKLDLPTGKSAGEVLREKAYIGCQDIFGSVNEEQRTRLEYELEVIEKKGYSPYFLLESGIVNFANDAGIYTNTRGSAAGSLVSYCIGITTVDPLYFRLPFERFLNPFRPSPPDIDLDVADIHRDALIHYLADTYGQEKVGQICTFGTMKARAAVRDIGRVMGMPYSKVDKISKTVPEGSQGFPMTLKKALETTPELQKMKNDDPEIKRLLDMAQKVEGNARHISVHAAAVIVGPDNLVKFTPLQQETGGGDRVITQYEMHACEDVGLIKLDILGIANLTILANAVKLVEKLYDIKINIKKIPLDDTPTYEMLARGETFGVFQLAGGGMTKYLIDLKPERIEDVMAMVALYRPGPMGSIPEYIIRKHNPAKVSYFVPGLEKILDQSYGIITYQDDVLFMAIQLAGYNWEEADKFRKAIGKKIVSEMEAQHSKFVEGCITHSNITREKAEDLFKQIETFAAYGFNKAHAASYGIVAYWTAYIKAHYPVEYMTALMSVEAGDTDKIVLAISECEKLGIKVLPPDVNESLTDFTVVSLAEDLWLQEGRARDSGKAIRFGLSAIKNVGTSAITAILDARKNGDFISFTDFLRRVDLQKVNKRVAESLIKSGALDRFGNRAQLLAALPIIREGSARIQKRNGESQVSLFGSVSVDNTVDNLPNIPEMSLEDKLKLEKELLGFYLSDNPVKKIVRIVSDLISHKIAHLDPTLHLNQTVTLAGVVSREKLVNTKKNNSKMAFVTLQDDTGTIDCIIFPKLYAENPELWHEDSALIVRGKVDNREDKLQVVVDSGTVIDTSKTPRDMIHEIFIKSGTPKHVMQQVSNLLKAYPGDHEIVVAIESGNNLKKITLPYKVEFGPVLEKQVEKTLHGW
ncbi:MAG: polymerase III, alpha subunit protein [Candidatus Collierbacteria bacterium GW2011_GWC2_44_18]|uniref:DNA polymerase III subunit alpha n=2 Tax=Microgenomates group TaxID=1794810 RepID=A0A0G1J7K2_9BACT|nr:MAG: DNA polymerase III, alpha subunit, DNA polymerase III subunit alpha [Microgenomates group bacterium GW2011_GWC1_44_10]KKT49174.1 MAG: polymerase III, alpha subunit protein [Candidatus Collierbacteria bacterium GW2011_GWC2_44_18]KKT67343.1 MAG: polymerase III, alpha subunit protein [Candidatus Woesebacteria bacterium GW2011_GWA2_44_33]